MAASTTSEPRILVAGLGNELLRDDGVGVHAVRLFQCKRSVSAATNAIAVEVGTCVLDALHLFEWADYILAIDAMRAGQEPGSLYLASDDDIEEGGLRGGLHELSLLGALRLLQTPARPCITVLGVEPEIIDYGMELSGTVQSVLPAVIRQAESLVANWGLAPNPALRAR